MNNQLQFNSSRVAFFSLLSKASRALIGPISIIFISQYLSDEEKAFYYTFMSIVAMQQLLELGIGHTIKQYIAHSYNRINENKNCEALAYCRFSMQWFLLVSLFVFFIVGPSGYVYFSSATESNIVWISPWFSLILVSSLMILFSPCQLILEAIRKQEILFKVQLLASVIGAIFLWLSMYFGMGLYSISISLFVSFLITSIILIPLLLKEISLDNLLGLKVSEFKSTIKIIWPLLSRSSLTWGAGYFFWNGFNLIAFKVMPLAIAGKLLFSIAIARAIYNVASSLLISQTTNISWLIANDKYEDAKYQHFKFSMISNVFMILSCIFVVLLLYCGYLPLISNEVVSIAEMCQIFIFYILVLTLSSQNEFVRCHKSEPFVKVSVFNAIFVPIVFYVSLFFESSYYFIYCSFIVLVSIFASFNIKKAFLANHYQ